MEGEYGLKDMFFGVPVMLGRKGMEKIVEYKFDDEEKAMFEKSAASVKETHEALEEAGEILKLHRSNVEGHKSRDLRLLRTKLKRS